MLALLEGRSRFGWTYSDLMVYRQVDAPVGLNFDDGTFANQYLS